MSGILIERDLSSIDHHVLEGAEPSGAPIAALNRQIQVLSKELSEAKVQLERASKIHRSEMSAVSTELDACKEALKLSRGHEAQVTRERDKLDASCKQLEADLGTVSRKCDLLAREHDQVQKQSREELLGMAAEEAEERARRECKSCCTSGCQTDVDSRDKDIRCGIERQMRL